MSEQLDNDLLSLKAKISSLQKEILSLEAELRTKLDDEHLRVQKGFSFFFSFVGFMEFAWYCMHGFKSWAEFSRFILLPFVACFIGSCISDCSNFSTDRDRDKDD